MSLSGHGGRPVCRKFHRDNMDARIVRFRVFLPLSLFITHRCSKSSIPPTRSMKTVKIPTKAALVACLVIVSAAASQAQTLTLIDVNIAPDGSAQQAAVLGTATDTYNNYGSASFQNFPAGTTLFSNAASSTGAATGVSISTGTGFNVYIDNSSTTSPNPSFLMDGYAFNETNASSGFPVVATTAFTLSGLTAYDGKAFTLVVYAAGNNSGEGNTLTLSGASTATGSTTGADRNINNGVGDAYQTFTGTVTGDTLTITAAPNDTFSGDNGGNTEVNGFQLQIAPEPSTWATMLAGLGLLFGIARLRRRVQI